MNERDVTKAAGPPARNGSAGRDDFVKQVRDVSFSTAMRGYDKDEVDAFLRSIAERLEGSATELAAPSGGGGGVWDSDVLKRELERVSESTKGILTAAEEAARKLRADTAREVEEAQRKATEHAQRVRREAEEFAEKTREAATEEVRRLRLEASRKAEEATTTGEQKAEELLESALRRRRVLEARIERLLERRDRVVDHLSRLAEQLSAMAAAAEKEDGSSPEDTAKSEPADRPAPEARPAGKQPLTTALGEDEDEDADVDDDEFAGDDEDDDGYSDDDEGDFDDEDDFEDGDDDLDDDDFGDGDDAELRSDPDATAEAPAWRFRRK